MRKIFKTYKIQIKKGHKMFGYFSSLCNLSKNLYNTTNYYIRQYASAKSRLRDHIELHPNQMEILNIVEELKDTKYYPKGDFLNYNTLDYIFKNNKNIDYISLPSHSNQWIIKSLVEGNYKSFFAAIKDYKNNPNKYLGRPKMPKYIKKENTILFFSNITCKIKDDKYLKFPKTKLQLNIGKLGMKGILKQVRVIPHTSYFEVEVVLDINLNNTKISPNNKFMSIDIGLNNLCAISNSFNKDSYLIKGTPLKSINQYFNKKLSYYKSILKKVNKKDYSIKIDNLYRKRNNKITDYMHKVSKTIIELCISNDISTIVVGHNNNWKQNINIGKANNQNFISIPLNKLITQIQYKAALYGITVILQEESYTSKASFLDGDDIPILKKNNNNDYTFSGKRIKRGLYKSKEGILLNADINGSLNILKKYLIHKGHPMGITKKESSKVDELVNLWSIGFRNNPVIKYI